MLPSQVENGHPSMGIPEPVGHPSITSRFAFTCPVAPSPCPAALSPLASPTWALVRRLVHLQSPM